METAARDKQVLELLERKDGVVDEIAEFGAKLNGLMIERDEINEALADLLDMNPGTPVNGNGEKTTRICKLCEQPGHITGRTKTADGRDTCKTFPNGKPKEAA